MPGPEMSVCEIERWLREDDPQALATLWEVADELRRRYVGDEVHIRGLLEISNNCARSCAYCGLRAENVNLPRYRLTWKEILEGAATTAALGWGTIVMQAGEDYGITREWLAEVIAEIKRRTDLAVTLSMGERPLEDLRAWREAGADRYLLRFETSDPGLYARIHPPLREGEPNRLEQLEVLRELGYEAGGGVMIGIPGQSYASLARDIAIFRAMDMDMIGVGPFIPNPDTPAGCGELPPLPEGEQVPATDRMGYKVVALTRIVRPDANIPATTALATVNRREGRWLGLQRGANVIMPNVTPRRYREMYRLYPGKAIPEETADATADRLAKQLGEIGRTVAAGRGDRRRMLC